MQYAPQALDATFGLRTVGGNEGDAQLFQGAPELGGLAFSGQLFFHCPVVIVADEDAAVIAVKSQRHAETAQQLAQQAEIAKRGFRREELCGQDFPGGVILHAESGELRAASFEPIVLTMSGSTTLARRPETVLAQQTAQCFATEREALALDQFLAQMVVIEARIGSARQLHDPLAYGVGQPAVTGPPAVRVCQSRLPVFAHTLLQAFNLAHAQTQECGGSGTRHVSPDACVDYAHSL